MKSVDELVKQKVNAHLNSPKKEKTSEEEILPGQVYHHYKSPEQLYEIVGIARHSESLKEMVVYKAIYEGEFPLGRLWVRPKRLFLQNVTYEGKEMKRFTLVKK